MDASTSGRECMPTRVRTGKPFPWPSGQEPVAQSRDAAYSLGTPALEGFVVFCCCFFILTPLNKWFWVVYIITHINTQTQIKLLTWLLIQTRNGALSILKASGLGTPPSFTILEKAIRVGIILISGEKVFQRAGLWQRRHVYWSPQADIPWLIGPLRYLTCCCLILQCTILSKNTNVLL